MIGRIAALAVLLSLASCPRVAERSASLAAPDLETAAIARGLVRDPGDRDIAGLYARDTDRICIVRAGQGHRIGAFVDYGDGIACSGAGRVTRTGETLAISLGKGCELTARFDGDRIVFPALAPDACRALCSGRARFDAVEVERLSDSEAEARTMRAARNRLPCATDAGS
ncbi:hypothetical protein [Sphingomonas sp. RS2018]